LLQPAIGKPVFDIDILAVHIAEFPHAALKSADPRITFSRNSTQNRDEWALGWDLRMRGSRPHGRATEKVDEVPSSHEPAPTKMDRAVQSYHILGGAALGK
jgi:hypothetical protein